MAGQASKENGKLGGRPPGVKNASTLEKERVLAEVRQRIMRKADQILNAQFTLAQGQTFLYKIEKTKVIGPKGGVSYRAERPKLVTNEWEIQAYLDGEVDKANGDLEDENNPEATYYYLTAVPPNNQAIDSMLDRTFDKPRQGIEHSGEIRTISDVLDQLDGQETTGQTLETEPPVQDPQQTGTDGNVQDEQSTGTLQSEQVVSEPNT